MISNLDSAKSLVKADLEHARGVLDLWNRQVSELEKTLDQMEAVGQSRVALRDQHSGVKAIGASLLTAQKAAPTGAKRGRKPKAAAVAEPAVSSTSKKERVSKKSTKPDLAKGGEAKRGRAKSAKTAEEKPTQAKAVKSTRAGNAKKATPAKKRAGAAQPKFKDPNSDKTWAGHGRRPHWMKGDPLQYAMQSDGAAETVPDQADSGSAQA